MQLPELEAVDRNQQQGVTLLLGNASDTSLISSAAYSPPGRICLDNGAFVAEAVLPPNIFEG